MARVDFGLGYSVLMSPLVDELYGRIRAIPRGCCTNYGALGRTLSQPVSGYLVGRWIAACPPDVPWQRVVGKDGSLLTGKRDASLGVEQERLLRAEGVPFTEDGCVDMKLCFFDPYDRVPAPLERADLRVADHLNAGSSLNAQSGSCK
jgi:methylated-DNA-protein-cysteine methyltransferase-like protein